MKALRKLEAINLPGLMVEHIHLIMNMKDGKHRLTYGYLLNRVFDHFGFRLQKGVSSTIKQAFSQITLMEWDCIEGIIGNKPRSQVSDLLDQQGKLKQQVEELTIAITARHVDIVALKA